MYRSTGSVLLRWHIARHCAVGVVGGTSPPPAPLTSASALLQGAEAVLRQYRRARAKLAAATKDLGGRGDGSDG
jgi:hypothetical protein